MIEKHEKYSQQYTKSVKNPQTTTLPKRAQMRIVKVNQTKDHSVE
jgi:hypothetical protein